MVLQLWFGPEATNEFIWQVCNISQLSGMNQLPAPSLYPRPHRELLRALVIVRLGVGASQVKLSDLDAAYSTIYTKSTPLNINKKKYRKP